MITYIICSILVIASLTIIMAAIIKNQNHKKKQMNIANTYDRLTRECKLAIEYSEFLCYRYIGLDRRNKKLVLIDHGCNEKQELCIPLQEIGESRIIQVKDGAKGIKTILLELRNKKDNKAIRFCFFDKRYDPAVELLSLSRKAIHWKTKIDIHKHSGRVNLEAEYVL